MDCRVPSPRSEGMFDMNFGSAVDGRRTAMMFGSSMDIFTAARDAFGLIGSGAIHSAPGRGAAAGHRVVGQLSEDSGSGEIFMTALVSKPVRCLLRLGWTSTWSCSASCRRQGLGLIWMLRPTLWWTSMRWLCRDHHARAKAVHKMSAPTSSNFEDLGPSQMLTCADLDWTRHRRESGLVWALATGVWSSPCWLLHSRSNLLRFGGGSPHGRGRDDVQHQTRFEAPDASGTANQLRSILTPTKTNGMERFSMDFPEGRSSRRSSARRRAA